MQDAMLILVILGIVILALILLLIGIFTSGRSTSRKGPAPSSACSAC